VDPRRPSLSLSGADERLLERLSALMEEVDPVPPSIAASASSAFAYRSLIQDVALRLCPPPHDGRA
jgi:hypothetical protein